MSAHVHTYPNGVCDCGKVAPQVCGPCGVIHAGACTKAVNHQPIRIDWDRLKREGKF